MRRKIVLVLECENEEVYQEIEESLDYFTDHLDNVEGNVEGFSYHLSEEKTKSARSKDS